MGWGLFLSVIGREAQASTEAKTVKALDALRRERRLGHDTDPAVHLTNEVPGRGPGTTECLQLRQEHPVSSLLCAEAVTLQEAFS